MIILRILVGWEVYVGSHRDIWESIGRHLGMPPELQGLGSFRQFFFRRGYEPLLKHAREKFDGIDTTNDFYHRICLASFQCFRSRSICAGTGSFLTKHYRQADAINHISQACKCCFHGAPQ